MEREILLTGIGGQGVQLGAEVLARAATLEGLHVLYLGTYGGTMRGGSTNSTVVIGDAEISTPPIVARAGSAIAMHDRYWPPVAERLRPDALVLLNSSVFQTPVDGDALDVRRIEATQLAAGLGSAMAGTMVLVAAWAALTRTVGLEAMMAAMESSIPSYRSQLVDLNRRALELGFTTVGEGAAPSSAAEETA